MQRGYGRLAHNTKELGVLHTKDCTRTPKDGHRCRRKKLVKSLVVDNKRKEKEEDIRS